MFNKKDIDEYTKKINLSDLLKIAKHSAQIGNDILKDNYNKIQTISSKGRKGDLVTNVDLEVENKIKEYLTDKTIVLTCHRLLLSQEGWTCANVLQIQ